MSPAFGKLEPVEIRSCWPDEARNFTPWLATPEGVAMLSEALGLDLAVQATEVDAGGPFCCDILARDLATDKLVVIENQLEKTNHDHLGKALTYGAVLNAQTVVWIAKTFTDEHRKAVEYLNEATRGNLLIYGIELQVWRIGQSLPAPRFEVLCAPNEIVRQVQQARDAGEQLSDTKLLQQKFWQAVRDRLHASGKIKSTQTPRPQYWYNVALGRSGIFLVLVANTWEKFVGVQVYISNRVATAALQALAPMRSAIEAEIGEPLQWNPNPEKSDKIIALRRKGDIADPAQFDALASWIADYTVRFHKAFAPRIATVNLDGSSQPEMEDNANLAPP